MAQHDGNIANADGATVRADINDFISAILTNSSGATAPSTTFAYQWWADTTSGLLKQRNAANSGWVTIGTMASTNLGLLSLAGGTMTGLLATLASSTGGAGLNLPHGAAPSSPTNGDVWSTTSGLFAQINGATQILGGGFKVGSFTRDTSTASGNQSVTGVGFKPRALLISGGNTGASWATFAGLTDGTTTGSVQDNGPINGGSYSLTTDLLKFIQSGSDIYTGSLSSFDSDGFTLSWVKTGSTTGTATMFYMAIR